jgi:hypothetical protein
MSWWMLAIAIFVLVRISRARGCHRAPLGPRHGRHFDIGAAPSPPWRQRLERRQATSSPPALPSATSSAPSKPCARAWAGRIEVAEYERSRRAVPHRGGKRLVQGS